MASAAAAALAPGPALPGEDAGDAPLRPRTRADCADGPRPCPWVSCRHHLYLEVDGRGHVRLAFPDKEPWELRETCALDVAERGEHTLEYVGRLLNLTRERIRQLEERAPRDFPRWLGQEWRQD